MTLILMHPGLSKALHCLIALFFPIRFGITIDVPSDPIQNNASKGEVPYSIVPLPHRNPL